ncbi:hypothetical protein SDC9_147461 [bioreactor metagenome]|uniref:Uncharacterized protein n=1 Tax=bioreactor metagenome TaxID=1076179 RepID=A0A645EER7_9ZZZZ
MSLFDLVEEHHRVGLAAYRLGELSALLVADIAGRSADQSGYRELFHVFAHVNAHDVVFVVKQRLGQGFGKLGFAYAGRTQKQEGADGAVRVLDARAGAQDGFGDLGHRFVLPDDTLVQDIFEMQKFLAFPLHELGNRNPGPAADDAGYFLLGYPVAQQGTFAL